eukprot:Seg5895.1 transcript_id=Seg5895.1/GoldUCD/mRNA.D3Y31 product="hypothetical protein" protein_id=Seg5895.1/GoldUCD/D3Y31
MSPHVLVAIQTLLLAFLVLEQPFLAQTFSVGLGGQFFKKREITDEKSSTNPHRKRQEFQTEDKKLTRYLLNRRKRIAINFIKRILLDGLANSRKRHHHTQEKL